MVYIGLVRSLLGVILLAGWALGMCDKGLTISILRCVWTYYSITLLADICGCAGRRGSLNGFLFFFY
jgi:hypothetical protein